MNKENIIKKNCQTIFPMGFGVKKTVDKIIILDFINQIDNINYEVISSLAMSEIKANDLIKALERAINNEEKEEKESDETDNATIE